MSDSTSKQELTSEQKAEKELVALANRTAKDKEKAGKVDKKSQKSGPSTGMKIAIGAFSLFIAISMMLPSLANIFSNSRNRGQQKQQASPESINQTYQKQIQDKESQLQQNPDNLPAHLDLAQTYMSWSMALKNASKDQDNQQHATELINKALAEYDTYLASNDSDEVRVSRAIAQYYSGDQSGAVDALKAVTERSPDYASGWLNLGMMYRVTDQIDLAKEALQTAIEKDPDNSAGVKQNAQKILDALNGNTSATSSDSQNTK
ncbi:MAG: tetratricopeptide repeat protein [Atopobiaceae bacterium]|nr:tetratricopeptide repeat protein [Atopobiaceae bacterium]